MGHCDNSHAREVILDSAPTKGVPASISNLPHTVCSSAACAPEIFYPTQFRAEMKEHKHLCGCESIKSLACIPIDFANRFLFIFL